MAQEPARSAVHVVVEVLAPYLGGNMARAAVRGQASKLGLSPTLDGSDLDRLLEALAPGLAVFVGREKTRALTAEILRLVRGADPAEAHDRKARP
jgi:hypothetical protein